MNNIKCSTRIVTASDWLRPPAESNNSIDPPTVAISSGGNVGKVAAQSRRQPQINTLKWKVLLYSGGSKNSKAAVEAAVASSPEKFQVDESNPIWSSAVRISPRTVRDDAAAKLQPVPTISTSPRSTQPKRAVTSAIRKTTAATFSKERGLLLHDASVDVADHVATLPDSSPPSIQVPVAVTKASVHHRGVSRQATPTIDIVQPQPQTAAPPFSSSGQQQRPTSAPTSRDIQQVKRLIRMVQIETGESTFRSHMDARVLQSLIPTASHRAGFHGTTKVGIVRPGDDANRQPQSGSTIANDGGEGNSPTRIPAAPSRPRTAESRGANRSSKTTAPPLSLGSPFTGLSHSSSTQQPTVVTSSMQGDLCLGVHQQSTPQPHSQYADREPTTDDGATVSRAAPAANAVRMPSRPSSPPRPVSARVAKPTFTYQRTFDGHTTLSQYWSGNSAPRFFHFSADTIPVVGRM